MVGVEGLHGPFFSCVYPMVAHLICLSLETYILFQYSISSCMSMFQALSLIHFFNGKIF